MTLKGGRQGQEMPSCLHYFSKVGPDDLCGSWCALCLEHSSRLLSSGSEEQQVLVQGHKLTWHLIVTVKYEPSPNSQSTVGAKDRTLGQELLTVLCPNSVLYLHGYAIVLILGQKPKAHLSSAMSWAAQSCCELNVSRG